MHDGTILQKMGQLCLVRTEMISRGLKRMFPLIGWRDPIFSRMKNVAKITPAQIIICCQHGIIKALHTFFVRDLFANDLEQNQNG